MARFKLPPEQLERLGKVPDHVIAKECYVSKQLIGKIRRVIVTIVVATLFFRY